VRVGPIPAGVPINLLSNIDLDHDGLLDLFDLAKILWQVKSNVHALPDNPSNAQLSVAFSPLITQSKCPDYVVNRGHYFGTDYTPHGDGLNDEQKSALIEFLKTF
jgi:hypothetical protein